MNLLLKSIVIFSLLISNIAKPFTIDTDSLKSPAAFAIYGAIFAHVGGRFADKAFDSSFYKLRKIINLLTSQEEQLEAVYQEKMIEIAQSKLDLNTNQKHALIAGYPRYKKNLKRKKTEIIDSTKSEDEKEIEIGEIDTRLALIKKQKNEKSDSLFEQLLQQAGVIK